MRDTHSPSGTPFTKLSILMPIYNEARTLGTIIERVLKARIPLEIEIVAVDDGSTDGSSDVLLALAAEHPEIIPILQGQNRGKAAAVRLAIEHMTGDVAIIQDADLEYDPDEITKVIKPILDGRADAVYGSRFASSPERRVLMFWHSIGNKLLTWLANVLTDLNLTDMETCYKAVRAEILKSLELKSSRFGIEPELTVRLAQWGAVIYEVPISYHGRSYVEGKKIGWKDGVQAILTLFRARFLDTAFSKESGHTTLESLRSARAMNRWILSQFPITHDMEVLEAGCGVGNLTSELLGVRQLTAVDLDSSYVRALERKYGHMSNVEFKKADLEDPHSPLRERKFDAVLCVNVLEHLDQPARAMKLFRDTLREDGRVMLLVPAHQWLFSSTDRALGHRLRYSREQFAALAESGGFRIEELRPFNRLGVLGWWINKITGKSRISPLQARVFGAMMPLVKLAERITILPGLSWVLIAVRST